MKKYSEEYKDFLYETLEEKFKDKLSEQYISLKKGILDLLEKTDIKKDELVNVQNFMNSYIKEPDKTVLAGFIEQADIFNFYLKHQSNIDEICSDDKYFDQAPSKNGIFSLYDIVINGTKFSVSKCMELMLKELF